MAKDAYGIAIKYELDALFDPGVADTQSPTARKCCTKGVWVNSYSESTGQSGQTYEYRGDAEDNQLIMYQDISLITTRNYGFWLYTGTYSSQTNTHNISYANWLKMFGSNSGTIRIRNFRFYDTSGNQIGLGGSSAANPYYIISKPTSSSATTGSTSIYSVVGGSGITATGSSASFSMPLSNTYISTIKMDVITPTGVIYSGDSKIYGFNVIMGLSYGIPGSGSGFIKTPTSIGVVFPYDSTTTELTMTVNADCSGDINTLQLNLTGLVTGPNKSS